MFRRNLKKFVDTFMPDIVPNGSTSAGQAALKGKTPEQQNALISMRATARQRDENRDLLYGIMREAMIRIEILSSSYRFQVLTIDPEGLVQKIMVDIAPQYGNAPELLQQLEGAIVRKAAAMVKMRVVGIYWRCDVTLAPDHVAPLVLQPAPAAKSGPSFAILSSDAGSRNSTGFEETQPYLAAQQAPHSSPVIGSVVHGVTDQSLAA